MAIQRAYPNLSGAVPEEVRRAVRQAFDYIYQLKGSVDQTNQAIGEDGTASDGVIAHA